jgi:hypothetical protein
MKDAKGHGSNPRGGNGQFTPTTGAKLTNAARERIAMRAMADRRTIQTRPGTPAHSVHGVTPYVVKSVSTDVPHSRGIVAATAGKTLAQVSSAGATQFKTGGG